MLCNTLLKGKKKQSKKKQQQQNKLKYQCCGVCNLLSLQQCCQGNYKYHRPCTCLGLTLPKAQLLSFFFLSLHHQHFQTMLKTKLNVLTLRKEPLPTVIFHEPEAIELCSTTPLTKSRTHAGYKVGSHEPNNPQIQACS